MKKKLFLSIILIVAILSLSMIANAESYSSGWYETTTDNYKGYSEIIGTAQYDYWVCVELYGDGSLKGLDSGDGLGSAWAQTGNCYITDDTTIYVWGDWERY